MSDIYESFAEHGEKRDEESPMVRLFYEVIMDGYEATRRIRALPFFGRKAIPKTISFN